MSCAHPLMNASTHNEGRNLRTLLGAHAGDAPADLSISDLTLDSRSVRPGAAFIALPGLRTHGVGFAAHPETICNACLGVETGLEVVSWIGEGCRELWSTCVRITDAIGARGGRIRFNQPIANPGGSL